jgi:hypothetical protein
MTRPELDHLELLAEIDALCARLRRWADSSPPWQPGELCRALVQRLLGRADSLRVRLEAPLLVATLGGSGTGKSALVNAIVGQEVVTTGKSRPTTLRPTLVCRPDLSPENLGIDPASVEVVHTQAPALADLVLVDCPDPDTTEDLQSGESTLARLRPVLAHCDVLLVTTTQQKYRSARVADELASAAPGARLVFVETHADQDADIRPDWRQVLESKYAVGEMFFVDSLAALERTKAGLTANGDFSRLLALLTRELAGTAGSRIRRANFLDLVADTLATAGRRIDDALPAVERALAAIDERRAALATHLVAETRSELLANRRQWEVRLLGQVAARWGFSPFAFVLRVFQGLGGLLSRALLLRARTPAQMALWGAMEGARSWRERARAQQAESSAAAAIAGAWDEAQLREAAVVLEGYAQEAGLDRSQVEPRVVAQEAGRASGNFALEVAAELDRLIDAQAARHTGWFTRWRYEFLLLALLGVLLYRLGKNFFYDSWLAPQPGPVFGVEFYVSAGFWLVLWCLLLFWAFSSRLRRGLRTEIDRLATGWQTRPATSLFACLESDCRQVLRWRDELRLIDAHLADLRRRLALPDERLGHRK